MTDVLVADDPLYEELYDVRREAIDAGNLVEEDMMPAMAALRERGGVHAGKLRQLLGLPVHDRHALGIGRPHYAALSWAACEAIFRDPKRFSSRIMHHPADGDEQGMGILEMDPPRHRAYRKTLQPMFVPSQTSTWWRERWVHDIVGTLVERLQGRATADLNLDYCARIPVHTITRAIGLHGDDALIFRSAMVKSSLNNRGTAESRKEAGATVERMLFDLIDKRRAQPEDDLVSALLAQQLKLPDGSSRPLSDREILINSRLIMLAGGGTTWRQLGITLWALLTHPDQWEAVRADRSLVSRAIEEALRWSPTAALFSRSVTEDTELEGVAIPEGSVVEIWLGAANRDPARWERPDVYDVHRVPQAHLGFGMGTHHCLGTNVARSEMSVGINALLDAFPSLRLDPDAPVPCLTGGLETRGVSALPVLLG